MKMSKRILSMALAICMIATMFTMLGTALTASAENDAYDSGNMPKAFFEKSYWGVGDDSVAVYKLADGSLRFNNNIAHDFGSYVNDGFETMFKAVGGFEIYLRSNEAQDEGYVFGISAPNNMHRGSTGYSWYIRDRASGKAMSGDWLAVSGAQINGWNYGKWCKLGVKFIDTDESTELQISINGVPIAFGANFSHSDRYAFHNGNLVDYKPISRDNSYIVLRPYFNGGFESSPNRNTVFYFASVDDADKVDTGVTRIAMVGDSITQGVGATGDKTCYVAMLQKKLGNRFDLFNCGASANTAMTNTFQTYTGQVIYFAGLLFDADYVVYALGSNDGQEAYWDKYRYYGYSDKQNSNAWRNVTVEKDDNGNVIASKNYADDGTTLVSEVIVNDDGSLKYGIVDASGTYRTYDLVWGDVQFKTQVKEMINMYQNPNQYNSNAHATVLISSALETWAGIADTWNRQQEVWQAQKEIAQDLGIGFIDNRTDFFCNYQDEDPDADNYYRLVSDDALHPNAAGHAMLADHVYDYLVANYSDGLFRDFTTTKSAPDYTPELRDVKASALNGGAATPISGKYFARGGIEVNNAATTVTGRSASIATYNSFDLGYNFNAGAFMYIERAGGECMGFIHDGTTPLNECADKSPFVSYGFGNLELRVWRYWRSKSYNAVDYVFGVFYNNKRIGDYSYVQSDMTCGFNRSVSEYFDFSYNEGNFSVDLRYATDTTSKEKVLARDTVNIINLTEADFAAVGYDIPLVNDVKYYAYTNSTHYNTTFAEMQLAAVTVPNDNYIITATAGGKIMRDGAEFDNTAVYNNGDQMVLTAVPTDADYYRFNRWVDGEGNTLSTDATYIFNLRSNTVVTAVFDEIYHSDYSITVVGNGSYTIDGAAPVAGKLYEIGTTHTVVAKPDYRNLFVSWTDGEGNVLSTTEDYTFKFGETTTLIANFRNVVTVTFTNRTNAAVSSIDVGNGDEITLPAYPDCFGYTGIGWNVNGTVMAAGDKLVITENTVVKAVYEKSSDLYSVNVTGSTADDSVSGEYTYNEKINVVFDASQLTEGQNFGGWAIMQNGQTLVISYAENYSFYVGANIDLFAVISADPTPDNVPIVNVTDVAMIAKGLKATFLTEYTVPAGYKYVASGVVYTANSAMAGSLTVENAGNGSIRSMTSQMNRAKGQLRASFKSKDGSAMTVYLTAYVTYIDGEGVQHTIYSPVYSQSTLTSENTDIGIEDGNEEFFD